MPSARLLSVLVTFLLAWPVTTSTIPVSPHDRSLNFPAEQSGQLSSAANAVASVRDQWAQFLNAKQIESIMTLYAPNAVFLLPSGERVAGAPSIRALTQSVWDAFTPDITMRGVTTKVSCDMAYDEGEFHETLTSVSTGAKQQSQGRYLMIFRRDSHGGWLIVEQVWTGKEPKRD